MDKGHNSLLIDLNELLQEALDFEFHDFKNNKYAFPKRELVKLLQELRDNVISGKYDN